MLSALLTTEGLMFAALSVSVTLSGSKTFGPGTVLPPTALAFIAASILAIVAAAGVLAWTDLFGGSGWPKNPNGKLEALALLGAIVAQPAVALIVAIGIWRG